MDRAVSLTGRERLWLGAVAAVGFFGLNGAFAWGLLWRPGALGEALGNPVSAAFILEALALVGVLAWLLARCGATRLHWGWFVALSLLGGILFALPVALLAGRRVGSPK